MPSFEVLLPLGAIAFYLFDAALLLYADELALEQRGQRWVSSVGLRLQVAGRRVYLPHPLRPGALLFHLPWRADATPPPVDESADVVASLDQEVRPLRWIVQAQALLLLIALPPVSIVLGAGRMLLALFVVFYALSLLSSAIVILNRRALGLSGRHCTGLVVEALACAPFAVNMVRKITLRRSSELHWLGLAQARFSDPEKSGLQRCLSTRVEELLALAEPGTARATELESFREHLKEQLNVAV
jgi:hypothetical protein